MKIQVYHIYIMHNHGPTYYSQLLGYGPVSLIYLDLGVEQ